MTEQFWPQSAGVINVDAMIRTISPILTEMGRAMRSGAAPMDVVTQAAVAAYLAGRGIDPLPAMTALPTWPQPAGSPPPSASSAPPPITITTDRPSGEGRLLDVLKRAMEDEATAALFYRDLLAQTPGVELKDYIRHAMDDELKHYRMLSELYRQHSGRTYEAEADPTQFRTLREGLKKAMDQEYEAFEFYRGLYLSSDARRVHDLFFELMTDEMEHATRFNYVLDNLGGVAHSPD